jgi:Na+/H+ antiporter NhaD/arsenite permease-like protein
MELRFHLCYNLIYQQKGLIMLMTFLTVISIVYCVSFYFKVSFAIHEYRKLTAREQNANRLVVNKPSTIVFLVAISFLITRLFV